MAKNNKKSRYSSLFTQSAFIALLVFTLASGLSATSKDLLRFGASSQQAASPAPHVSWVTVFGKW